MEAIEQLLDNSLKIIVELLRLVEMQKASLGIKSGEAYLRSDSNAAAGAELDSEKMRRFFESLPIPEPDDSRDQLLEKRDHITHVVSQMIDYEGFISDLDREAKSHELQSLHHLLDLARKNHLILVQLSTSNPDSKSVL